MVYDAIIIGKGPAGITASIYIKRAGFHPIVIGKDGGALEKAKKIENYYGFEDGITGQNLYKKGIKQAQNLGIEVLSDEVLDIQNEGTFRIQTKHQDYFARTIILATGNHKNIPNIKGIQEWEGKGVSYCAVCDAFFYRNKDVAIIGEGEYAYHEASHLIPLAKSVTILTNGKEPIPTLKNLHLAIYPEKIQEIRGDKQVEKIQFEDQTQLKVDGIFVAVGMASSSDLAKKLGILLAKDDIQTDENKRTNVPGVFAIGDCTGGILQISKAVYEGTQAGLSVIEFLKEERRRVHGSNNDNQ